MVDWRGSSLQIVVALIGSSLIITALTSISTFFSKPSLDIFAEVDLPNSDIHTIYRIFLVNNGYSAAKDVRLTMTYPDGKVLNATMVYLNENFTLKQTSDSVVAFSPRLSPGVKIGIENNITGSPEVLSADRLQENPFTGLPEAFDRLKDFDTDDSNNYYNHTQPFAITVTHNEGGNTFRPPSIELSGDLKLYFNIDALKFFIPIVTGILLVAIAYRSKRKSLSKFASNLLKDIVTAEKHLGEDNSKAIVSFKNYDFNVGNEVEEFDNYEDYKLIDDFYKGLKERESKILDPSLSSNFDDVLKEQNWKCFNQATSAHTKIDWKKFYKLDLILLITSIFLGSFFVTLVCEGVTALLWTLIFFIAPEDNLAILGVGFILLFIARTIGTYFIMKLILQTVHGPYISIHLFPRLYRKRTFLILSAVIMGTPCVYLVFLGVTFGFLVSVESVSDDDESKLNNLFNLQFRILWDISTTIFLLLDFSRMLLLTLIISRHPRKRKNESQDPQNDKELWKKV